MILATAESCTGGLLASILTDVDGFGRVFERGFVAYTELAKHEMLGVPIATLQTEGAVSEATATAMAEGALIHSTADLAIAVTGFAGPAGPGDTPGLVHLVALRRGRETYRRRAEFGPASRGGGSAAGGGGGVVRFPPPRAGFFFLADLHNGLRDGHRPPPPLTIRRCISK